MKLSSQASTQFIGGRITEIPATEDVLIASTRDKQRSWSKARRCTPEEVANANIRAKCRSELSDPILIRLLQFVHFVRDPASLQCTVNCSTPPIVVNEQQVYEFLCCVTVSGS
jgi:hypothetical protein